MLYLQSWLEDYIDLSGYTITDLTNIITLKSGEVDEVHEINDWFDSKVVVGQIKNVYKHPDADTLNVFDVIIGKDSVTIVSAAPNVREGLIVPVALTGAKIGNITIAERKMRGIASQGMCCGMSELMLETEDSPGLWELPETFQDYLGKSICEVFPEYFPTQRVFDIKYNPDKFASCGSHLGLALEIATVLENHKLLTPLARQLLDIEQVETQYSTIEKLPYSHDIHINFIDNSDYCHSFTLLRLQLHTTYTLDHVRRLRMYCIQKNLIGGLADLSNYLTFDIGNPTNFFSTLKVLTSQEREQSTDWTIINTIEQKPFKGLGNLKNTLLSPGIPVMKCGTEIITIPAISGGESTKLEATDTDILIETANFVGEKVARSSFSIGYRSDASRILSSDISQNLIKLTINRYLDILGDIVKTCEWVINFERDRLNTPQQFEVDIEYIASRLDNRGIVYWKEIIEQTLSHTGNYDSQTKIFTPNPFYSILDSQEKLIERIACMVGFENLVEDHLLFDTGFVRSTDYDSLLNLKRLLTIFGLSEILSRPFIAEVDVIDTATAISLLSTHNDTLNYLQDSISQNILRAVSRNIIEGVKYPAVFESTKIYSHENNNLIEQKVIGIGVVADTPYLATSLIHSISTKTGIATPKIQEISNKIKKQYGIPLNKKVWYIELHLNDWDGNFDPYPRYFTQSDFPEIVRTLSLEVDLLTKWADIASQFNIATTDDIQIRLNPIERIDTDTKSKINFEVLFVSDSRTLENTEIDTLLKTLDLKFD
jgi:phenylalanyl-tRNA synthetase beta chain